jgi:uncharacterized membrane protein
MLAALAVLVVVTIVGLIVFWPSGTVEPAPGIQTVSTQGARVTKTSSARCLNAPQSMCENVTVELSNGKTTTLEVIHVPGLDDLERGDMIRVIKNPPPPPGANTKLTEYSFFDFDRRTPILGLAVMFVALLLATGRLNGLRALVGLAASILIVLKFVIPSILLGNSAFGVALVGSLAVMLVTIPLS